MSASFCILVNCEIKSAVQNKDLEISNFYFVLYIVRRLSDFISVVSLLHSASDFIYLMSDI
jgi:hypothetical protein